MAVKRTARIARKSSVRKRPVLNAQKAPALKVRSEL
jgi:hypothetical protein